MGLFGSIFNRGKAKATTNFKPVTVPYRVPAPPMDPKNARYTDIFYSGTQGKVWNHTYGPYTAHELDILVQREPFTDTVIKKILNETIRRGQEWKEKYAGYCPKCKKEYKVMPDAEPVNPETGEESEEEIYLCEECE